MVPIRVELEQGPERGKGEVVVESLNPIFLLELELALGQESPKLSLGWTFPRATIPLWHGLGFFKAREADKLPLASGYNPGPVINCF